MANVATHGVGKLVRKVHAYAEKHGIIRPVTYKYGPWKVIATTGGSASTYTVSLMRYGTEMLRWRYTLGGHVSIEGTWTGWGSVSDQSGVNAALHALGSSLRYSRDTRGGGPRINPHGAFVVGKVSSVSAISPATPYWMR